ncbi:MAG TPA: hypothetical protein VHQ20_00515 [Patescibacteria group bacterium]|jgi:hypothetical protein|nr:hypothetical protein [Patescibacteria group bacterium]
MADEKLESLVNEYAELAKDKNIDAAALLGNALLQDQENKTSTKVKRWAYLISISVPPSGILIGLYFYFSDKSDGKQTAYVCIGVTLFSLLLSYFIFKAVISGSGASVQQIEQIKPSDIYQLSQ